MNFTIEKGGFKLNGEPFRVIAGAIHYFRVPAEYWRDRLLKLKACGFNTVETYVAWNMHEPKEGVFDYSDMLDIEKFLDIANELGLYAIVRPGPYICSEWDFGGLPWWLLKNDSMALRCMDKDYLAAVDRFFDDFIPKIAKHQITEGGNVILVQVENEYGSYGDDSEYIRYLADGMKKRGINVPFFTSDGAEYQMLTAGTLPEIHKTANFGSRAKEQFARLREYQPDGPLMCTEFWNGWFDHWTENHHSRDPQDAANALDEILSLGGSVSAYMFHGGTNFGYMNGANDYDFYEPTVSSYDDDAPVNENGALTEKYFKFREVISKYAPIPEVELPAPIPTKNYGEIKFKHSAKLFENLDVLSTPVESVMPLTMEKLGQGYGFVLYKTQVRGPREEQKIRLQDVHDRGYIYRDGKFVGIQYRNDKEPMNRISIDKEGNELAIPFKKVRFPGDSLDFSFSGIKTAVINHYHNIEQKGEVPNKADIAASFQRSVCEVMVDHLLEAARRKGCSAVALAGGVACNSRLRAELDARSHGLKVYYPSPILCTDNAAMIGCCGYYEARASHFADLSLNAIPYLGIDLK